jgi:hypothetical protein
LGVIDKFGQQQRRTATRLNDIDVLFNLLKLLSTCLAATEEGGVNLQQQRDTPKDATRQLAAGRKQPMQDTRTEVLPT